jgi:hypothetical protein
MQNSGIVFIIVLALASMASMAALYLAFGIARQWWEKRHAERRNMSLLDSHIAAEWTQARLRLDSVLRLIKRLAISLEQEAEKRGHLDPSDPIYESEAFKKVGGTLRNFTFDKHLREECRVLITLLQFCGRDLADTQGLDMTQKLIVLAKIQAAIGPVDGD